jgi:CRP/FNR family cyclic AMP-dependent transcriptional regulator
MTLEPSRFYVIPRGDVEGLIERNPVFARHLIYALIAKVRSLTETVRDLALKDVYGRLVKFLDTHSVEQDGRRIVQERLTQNDIASRIGASREMVSRNVKDLSAGGYISVEAKHNSVHKKLPAQW